MHKRITIWKPDGIVEHIEADQSFFRGEVNNVDKRNFVRQLENISPCSPVESGFDFKRDDVYYLVKLYPLHGFTWEYETIGGYNKWSGTDDEDV